MNHQADLALLFPGSGSQYKGMMRSLYESSSRVQDTLHEADEILGFELSRLMMEGSTVKLNRIGHMLRPSVRRVLPITAYTGSKADRFQPTWRDTVWANILH